MAVVTFEKETTTSLSQDKVFKVFILQSDSIIPKIMPQVKIEFVEGNGGPGSIKKTTFGQGNDAKYIKSEIEATDKDNFTHCYTIFEGEPWQEGLDKTSFEVKVSASSDGGSIIKSTSKYYPKPGCEINEERIKIGADKAFDMFKAIEAYVLANPDV
ncbi:major allergen Pru av 1-like [Mercurialis annua]|uniref:major allergen Pru av 1-like n=1 Tax=Mercurialis annua TaxID=3986 RepID=UPI00215E5C67|nr:major allergen Pru av 1-like [Mercurialis annua]